MDFKQALENKAKVISLIGNEKGDLAYYLSRALEDKKYRVLCIDNSTAHDLFHALHKEDKTVSYIEREKTVFMRDVTVGEDRGPFDKFDAVVVFLGHNEDDMLIEISDLVVLVLDQEIRHGERIHKYNDIERFNNIPNERSMTIIRDKATEKIHDQLIKKTLGLKTKETEVDFALTEEDYACYINFVYNGYQLLSPLSSDFKIAIKEILNMIGAESKKKTNIKKKVLEEVEEENDFGYDDLPDEED